MLEMEDDARWAKDIEDLQCLAINSMRSVRNCCDFNTIVHWPGLQFLSVFLMDNGDLTSSLFSGDARGLEIDAQSRDIYISVKSGLTLNHTFVVKVDYDIQQ